MSNNRRIGNSFEAEFCEALAQNGYWVHNLAQNSAGQPADVIAVRNGIAHLIDCKVCSGKSFALSRIEENQRLSMRLWSKCHNGEGWFAVRFGDKTYMVTLSRLDSLSIRRISEEWFKRFTLPLEEWLVSNL